MRDAPARPLAIGIDTCTDLLEIAILADGKPITESRFDSRGAHSERLLPELNRLLGEVGRSPVEIGAIGVTAGPGRFTSLRIGLATAQGLAFALGIPLTPVSALDALALVHAGACDLFVSALDGGAALYAAAYRYEGPHARQVLSPRFEAPAALAEAARAVVAEMPAAHRTVGVAGSGAARLIPALAEAGITCRALLDGGVARVAARLAWTREAPAVDPALIEPFYLRKTQAEERQDGNSRTHDRAHAE